MSSEVIQADGSEAFRRQEWMRNSVLGLFLHWGMRTSPPYTDVRAWEDRVTADGWSADYWVDTAVRLRAGYLVLASFHSRLGYVRAWPSEVPGSPATRRDFLGELISAARSRGLNVLVYITDDPRWHDEAGVESLDSSAYSAFKDAPHDLTTRDGFGHFAYDNFVELMRRYPDLAGFWIDKENAYWRRSGLYQRIRAERPGWIIASNDPDIPPADRMMDVVSPAVTSDAPVPRLTESCFTVAGSWWYAGEDPEVDHSRVIGRIVANAGSSTKSLLAFCAQHGGRFPPNQEAFRDFAAAYLGGIWESIGGTEGGGSVTGPHDGGRPRFTAVSTVRRDDPDRHYIHVVARPPGDTIRVRDNGRQVLEVLDVRTGDRLAFTQSGGHLTISGITSWDPHDTVFELRTARTSSGIVPPSAPPHPTTPANPPHHTLEGTSA
jgi:alpha-L-fucosidase